MNERRETETAFIGRVLEAIAAAEADGPITSPEVQAEVTGLSGGRLIGTLQRLAQLFEGEETRCYVEIGVFRGLSLISVAKAAPQLACFGVDSFQPIDDEQNEDNEQLVRDRIARLGATNAELIKADYEDALTRFDNAEGAGRKIGLLFVDGPHDYRSQVVCLLFAKRLLAPDCVIVVDDSNYNHVRQANRDFLLSHPDFKLAFEAYTDQHPANQSSEERVDAEAGWWNGVNILVRDAEDRLQEAFPPVMADKSVFINDHVIHTSKYAPLAHKALSALPGLPTWRAPLSLLSLYGMLWRFEDSRGCENLVMNTYSRDLPKRFARYRDKTE